MFTKVLVFGAFAVCFQTVVNSYPAESKYATSYTLVSAENNIDYDHKNDVKTVAERVGSYEKDFSSNYHHHGHESGSDNDSEGHYYKEHHHHHPKYHFKYGVEDLHTGDIKHQYEERDGDEVRGQYSLLDADGTIRKVNYKADKHNGFRAHVSKYGPSIKQFL